MAKIKYWFIKYTQSNKFGTITDNSNEKLTYLFFKKKLGADVKTVDFLIICFVGCSSNGLRCKIYLGI